MKQDKTPLLCSSLTVIKTLLMVSALCFSLWAQAEELLLPTSASEPYHQPIDLQSLVDEAMSSYQGNTTILVPPAYISFSAVLKELPQKKTTGYLYTAFDLLGTTPLPEVEYQMFLGASAFNGEDGSVIAVYVDNRLADAMLAQLDPETTAIWHGYHIYNFSRGPAIVIDNVAIAPSTED